MAHENLVRDQHVKGSSDRVFGFVFTTGFAIIAAWPLLSSGRPRWWAAGMAVAFGIAAIARPSVLSRLNRWWLNFGLLLGAIVSPIALGLLFFCVFAPIGLLMRLAGTDPLRLARDANTASYWRSREPPGPPPDSMERQF